MKNYTLANISSLLIGWFLASILYAFTYRIYGYHDTGSHMYPDILATPIVTVFSLPISLLINCFAIQIPRFYVKKLFFITGPISFSLLISIWGLIIYSILFGWFLSDRNAGSQAQQIRLLLFITAAINSLVFGFAFHILWKPVKQKE